MAGSYKGVAVPSDGNKIGYSGGKYEIPDHPIIPFIEGDGTGRDIWKASLRVFNAAVEKAYKGTRAVAWYEVFAGEEAGPIPIIGCGTMRSPPSRISRSDQRSSHHPRRRRH